MIEDKGTEAPAEDAVDALAEFPRDAKPWLDMIGDGERCFQTYNDKCDNIDKLYANLEEMSKVKADREFQIFWANLEVLKPSMYARPPVPVVVPRFKDMDDLPRKASEILERTLATTFDIEDVDATMRAIRDDLATNARGVVWMRYEASGEDESTFSEKVCFDHVDRRDFLHGPARAWREVPWVARRAWLTLKECRKRFGDIALKCAYEVPKDNRSAEQSKEKKAQVWELWAKDDKVVVWCSPGVADLLDVKEPWLSLEGFFPCPRPAYGTLQRGSLIPVPDFLYYRDQIEEINELTARISALCESLRMKGFYAQGNETLSDAIEKALKQQDNSAILVPVPSFMMAAGASIKDAIVWLPVVEVASVIKELIANRKQLIEDVYQITGLSDIMRGDSNANETLGAQKLKSQYGSVRIRDRQGELIRIAKDITRLSAEIIAENYQPATLFSMSQVQLPSMADVQQQMEQMKAAAEQSGQPAQPPGKPPVTIEDVLELFRADRVRPFILDVETDSTIQPDEDAEKQRATEYITAVGGFMQQALPVGQQLPQAVPVIGAMLKFTASKFRAGREMQGVIEKFVDEMTQLSQQPKEPKPDPEMAKVQAQAQADAQRMAMEGQLKQREQQLREADQAHKQAMDQANLQFQADTAARKAELEREIAMMKLTLDAQKHEADLAFRAQAAEQDHNLRKEKQDSEIRMGRDRQILDYRAKGVLPAAGDGAEPDPATEIESVEQQLEGIEQGVQVLGAGMADMATSIGQIAQTVMEMRATQDAPKRIVRDAAGTIVGVQQGDEVKQIVRDDSGRVAGLN